MRAIEFAKKVNSVDQFLDWIPTDIVKNVKFRISLHRFLANNPEAQPTFLEMCDLKPQIAFNALFFTYDPRQPLGKQARPFILRPQQSVAVEALKDAIDNQHDLAFDKTREEGATELICKMFSLYFLLRPETYFLVGSRKEDLVDKSVSFQNGRLIGPHQTLFHKIMYGLVNMPPWIPLNINKRHLFLQNLDNNAMIEGESTNESFGAGNRATAVLIDEAARIEPDVAQYLIDNVHDTTRCAIFNSTHFRFGSAHPYNKLLISNKIPVIELGYETNPEKSVGLYRSPRKGVVELIDERYYVDTYPELNLSDRSTEPVNHILYGSLYPPVLKVDDLPEKYAKTWVADGGDATWGMPRSVWLDKEIKRGRSRTDLAQNILRIPQGSADQFFDNETVQKIKAKYVCEPYITGNVLYDVIDKKVTNCKFMSGRRHAPFKWWGKLEKGRPDQKHNYVVACDISRGTGASNSVLAVLDVNNSELVGLYVNPYIDVTEFADLAVATCQWVGGINKAFLIWEANGPGETFWARVKKTDYRYFYRRADESKITRKRTQSPGWRSTPGVNGTKFAQLGELDAALYESLKEEKMFQYLIIHDAELCNELLDYMFLGDRIDVGLSSEAMDSSGARFAHGDRVIAAALAVLGTKEQIKGNWKIRRTPPPNSFQARFDRINQELEEEAENSRVFLY